MDKLEEIQNIINKLSKEEKEWLINFGSEPVFRKFLKTETIKMANKLVKKEVLEKGIYPNSKFVIYYVDQFILTLITQVYSQF